MIVAIIVFFIFFLSHVNSEIVLLFLFVLSCCQHVSHKVDNF